MTRQSDGKSRRPRRAARSGNGKQRVRRVDVERHSLGTILRLVRTAESRTRHDLEQLSGLGRAVVADRLATLVNSGLVEEGELGRAAGGRAPRLVRFRAEAGLVLVATMNPTSVSVGLANLSGKLLFEHHEAIDQPGRPEPAVKRLSRLFDWTLEQHGDDRPVWGIGIAMPGPLPAVSTMAADAGTSEPEVRPLLAELAARYGTPVSIRANVQMRTLGEWRAGNSAGAQSLLYVDLGEEISAGLLSDGHLVPGAQGAAGMIGHVPVGEGDDLPVCRCGNRGCLEVTAGAAAIVRAATRAAEAGQSRMLAEALAVNGSLTVHDVGVGAQQGDAFSAELLSRCGRQIGTVLAPLANACNPAIIVIGGEIAETGDILLAAIREAIYRRAHPLVTRDLRIAQSQLGNSAGLVGAAMTLVDEFFAADFLGEWVTDGSPLRHADALARIAGAVPGSGERAHAAPAG